MRTIFLRPGSYSTQDAINEINEMINTTAEDLNIAIAYLTYQPLIKALIERTKLNMKTKLILNTSDLLRPINPLESEIVISKDLIELINISQKYTNLEIKSLGVTTKKKYQNMHHKYVVSEERVIFGSLNWTNAAFNNNYECIYTCQDITVIDDFLSEFYYMWESAQNIHTAFGKIRGIICPKCESSDGVDFESYGPFCTFCGHKFIVM
jgi:phosphatidylserine/phosphatidylglycerophosphate/cardiolipin synthase-like enzyme